MRYLWQARENGAQLIVLGPRDRERTQRSLADLVAGTL